MKQVETWATVVEAPDYEVSTLGNVRRRTPGKGTRAGRPVKTRRHWQGYKLVRLSGREFRVHRLVMTAHSDRLRTGEFVCHRNGRKGDNRISNLQWGNRSENAHDNRRHKASQRRTSSPRLTADQLAELLRRVEAGETALAIALETGRDVPGLYRAVHRARALRDRRLDHRPNLAE